MMSIELDTEHQILVIDHACSVSKKNSINQLIQIKVNGLPLMNSVQVRSFRVGLTTARATDIYKQ